MAKPNYAFEKRQRERAKKEKKAEKLAQRKAGADRTDAPPDEPPVEGADAPQPAAVPGQGGGAPGL